MIIAHALTYFILGILISNVFNYGEFLRWEIIRDYMLTIDRHILLLWPFLQPLCGAIFALG